MHLAKEGNCVLPKGSHGFHSGWGKVMVVRDFPVGFPLSSRGHVSHPSWAQHGYMDVGGCHCVPTCGIPDEEATLGPEVMVIPSGRLPSVRDSPCGSSIY